MSNSAGSSGAAGRYQRSGNGLIGALLITVVTVVGFVLFRGAFSTDVPSPGREAIDYLSSVGELQDAEVPVVYPASLPDGWRVTAVDVQPVERPGSQPALTIDLLTADDGYAGIALADLDVDDLLVEYVDDDPTETEPILDSAGVVADWQGWTDAGGDSAYSTPYGARSLLVFGSVPAGELADLVDRLSDEPLGGAATATRRAPTPAG